MDSKAPREPLARREGLQTLEPGQSWGFDLALLTDLGNERSNNEDCYGFFTEGDASVVFAVADGVGGYEGGELASEMAIDVALAAYRNSPREWSADKRLSRAVQSANIEIRDRAMIVTELSRMATTLTAVSVDGGALTAAHVGDCRLYLIHDGQLLQLTKDHTVAAGRTRLGLLSKEKLRTHPERGTLTRSVGSELIVAVDRITRPLAKGDVLVVASDGLYATLDDAELVALATNGSSAVACRALVDRANEKGTMDNLTAAVFRQTSEPVVRPKSGFRDLLKGWVGR